jgi:methyl-accepting chemotaxis protein
MDLSFSLVKLQHQLWKVKLRSFLDGTEQISASEAGSHRDCDLGKWIYAEGLDKYGQETGMINLEKTHADFHSEVREVVELKARGKTDEAEAAYAKVRPLSDQVIDLIEQLEQRLK